MNEYTSSSSLSQDGMSISYWRVAPILLIVIGVAGWFVMPYAQEVLEPFLVAENWRAWRVWLRSFGLLAPLVSMSISVAQLFPLPIPAPTLPLANGWLFGMWAGTLVTWTGVMINGSLGYLLARGPGRRLLLRLVSTTQLKQAEDILARYGAWAIVVARLVPVLPFSAISVAAGLLRIRGRDYLLATGLGVLPSAFALALIGYQLSQGAIDWGPISLGVMMLASFALAGIPISRWLVAGSK